MVQLQKVHGSKNSFFLIDQTTLKQPLSQEQLINLAKNLTRNLLGGADGLLVVSDSNHLDTLGKMQVINADGSIASMCGNGLRTVARYLSEKYDRSEFKVETANADLMVKKESDWAPAVHVMSVEISPVSFAKADLPFDNLPANPLVNTPIPEFAPDLNFTAVAVPNPHLISFVDQQTLDGDLLGYLGNQLNSDNPYFPDGVNVNFAKIIDHDHLFVRTFERGVGFTNACGTGMSATSLAFSLSYPKFNAFDKSITVSNPGGFVQTRVHQINNQYWMELIGNATITHMLTVSEDNLQNPEHVDSDFQITETSEDDAYSKFVSNNQSL